MDKLVKVTHIGAKAQELLEMNTKATLVGVTSRGVFVQFGSGWTIFLSSEPFHGPLTVNLPGAHNMIDDLSPGQDLYTEPAMVSIPSAQLYLDLACATIWHGSLRPAGLPLPHDDRVARSKASLGAALEKEIDLSLVELIKAYLEQDFACSIKTQRIRQEFAKTTSAFRQDGFITIEDLANLLLGLGAGLTPWGDDILIGLMLALNRWGDSRFGKFQPSQINQMLLAKAWSCTTGLSAGLIECAGCGQADERLIKVLDSIFTGKPELEKSTRLALSWGSSSGAAALLGIALALN